MFMTLLFACTTTQAGELWLHLDHRDDDGRVTLEVPASWLRDAENPVQVRVRGGTTVDLREEARALRVGASRRHPLEQGQLVLSHEVRSGPAADAMALAVHGPKGHGLSVTLPLDDDALDPVRAHLDGAVDVEGLKLELDEAWCRQLEAAPPLTLLEITGPRGNTVKVSTTRR